MLLRRSIIDLLFRSLTRSKKRPVRSIKPKNVQSDPSLYLIWITLRKTYFPERTDIDSYFVYWSTRRQKRVLASCNIRQKRVSVAKELQDPLHTEWLTPLLYHEMCHAIIGEQVTKTAGKRQWHGVDFKKLERAHPEIPALDKWIKTGGWQRAVRRDRALNARRKGSQ